MNCMARSLLVVSIAWAPGCAQDVTLGEHDVTPTDSAVGNGEPEPAAVQDESGSADPVTPEPGSEQSELGPNGDPAGEEMVEAPAAELDESLSDDAAAPGDETDDLTQVATDSTEADSGTETEDVEELDSDAGVDEGLEGESSEEEEAADSGLDDEEEEDSAAEDAGLLAADDIEPDGI